MTRRICVFCGSASGSRPGYAAAARAVGEWIAQRGLTLVYGGGRVGLMGVLADAALAAGGQVTGVIPTALVEKETAHAGLSELLVVRTMHERKARMADLADAFLALPGGLGTMDEWFEIITWAQLGYHNKPIALLNLDGYYDPLLALLDHMVAEGFVRDAHRRLLLVGVTPAALLEQLVNHRPPRVDKWVQHADL